MIAQNEHFYVTGDSVVQGATFACVNASGRIENNVSVRQLDSIYNQTDSTNIGFTYGRPWRPTRQHPSMPTFASDHQLIDALYHMALDDVAKSIDSSGRLTKGQNISRLYCSIYLALAYLKPSQSMSTLRALVDKDTIIMQQEGLWPVVNDHIGWAIAAWEVYQSTGDHNWLRYSYRAIQKTMAINQQVLTDHTTGLMHGGGYASPSVLAPHHLSWMGYNDLFSCISLGNNILAYRAYQILDQMAEEIDDDHEDYALQATHLKDAINQHLWNEDRGHYSSFLYGLAYRMQAPTTDNTSQAMAVLWDIADDDRAENLIAHTPVSDFGVNVTYPPSTAIEPYFANPSWATTQALWNLAAATVGNENALRRGLGALLRAEAFYASRDIHIAGSTVDQLGEGAGMLAMLFRVIAGITLKPEGIEFHPYVPTGLPGEKHIGNFRYRDATLDITLLGTGSEIQSMTMDSKPMDAPFLPANVQGHHQLTIHLQPAGQSTGRITRHHGEVLLPTTPDVKWPMPSDSGIICNYRPSASYWLMVNGQRFGRITDSVFAIPQSEQLIECAVLLQGRYGESFISRPYLRFAATPQVAMLPDSSTTSSSLVVNVKVQRGGDYLIDIGYLPTGTLDVRKIAVNNHLAGTVVMAQDRTSTLRYSNMLMVKLLRGDNTIEITPIALPKPYTPCTPRLLRVITL